MSGLTTLAEQDLLNYKLYQWATEEVTPGWKPSCFGIWWYQYKTEYDETFFDVTSISVTLD